MHFESNQQIINGKCQDICPRTESQEKVAHASIKRPQAHKSFYQRSVKEEQRYDKYGMAKVQTMNPIERLWTDLKQAVHRRKPTNITELKWFCTEEWAQTPASCCAGLIISYKKRYLQLLLQKGVTPNIESKDSYTVATHRCVPLDHFSQ